MVLFLFLLIELPAWITGILLGYQAAVWVFFGLPILLAILGIWNRRTCRLLARHGLEEIGSPLSPADKDHFFKYSTNYFFPTASVSLSRFYSGVYLLCVIALIVEGYRWLTGQGASLWIAVSAVVGWLLASGLQVQYNPFPFAASRVRKDPLASSRFTQMALADLAAAERVREVLAQHQEIVGGDQYWKIFMNTKGKEL